MAVGLSAAPATFTRSLFGFAGRTLALQTDDPATEQLAMKAYGSLTTTPGRTIHHTAIVRRCADGRLHTQFDRTVIAMGDSPAAVPMLSAYYAVREIFARFAAAAPQTAAFYGSLVCIDHRGLLLLGPASSGKTLLAVHLALAGARFLGEETSSLDMRTGDVRALARKPSMRESGLAFLPAGIRARIESADNAIAGPRGRLWYALGEDVLGLHPSADKVHLSAVAFLGARQDEPQLRRVEPKQAINQMLHRCYARPYQLREVSTLKRAIRKVSFFDVEPGNPQQTAQMLVEAMRSCE